MKLHNSVNILKKKTLYCALYIAEFYDMKIISRFFKMHSSLDNKLYGHLLPREALPRVNENIRSFELDVGLNPTSTTSLV